MAKWGEIKCPRCEELEADRRKTYEALLKVTRIHDEVEAKLAQQDDLVQAAVAAALREAVAAVKKDADNDDISHGAAQWVSDTILALITPDAQAALDRVKAERERCAKIAWSHVDDETSGDPDFDAGWEAAACAITDAIRKGGE